MSSALLVPLKALGPVTLHVKYRLVWSNQLALGIQASYKLYLPQTISVLIQLLLQDDLLQARCSDSTIPQWQRMLVIQMLMKFHHQLMSIESARLLLALALLQITGDVSFR